MSTAYETACEIHKQEEAESAKFAPEFKTEAVRLARGEQGFAAAVRVLGISERTLRHWVDADPLSPMMTSGTPAQNSDQAEIARLKCALTRDKMERDVVAKTTEYFDHERK